VGSWALANLPLGPGECEYLWGLGYWRICRKKKALGTRSGTPLPAAPASIKPAISSYAFREPPKPDIKCIGTGGISCCIIKSKAKQIQASHRLRHQLRKSPKLGSKSQPRSNQPPTAFREPLKAGITRYGTHICAAQKNKSSYCLRKLSKKFLKESSKHNNFS
jgi:hypothetical protein